MIVHTFVLCALVVAKPLFDIMANYPEYFVVFRFSNPEIYFFALALVVALPLCLSVPVMLARAIGKRAAAVIQTAIVFTLAGVFILQLIGASPFYRRQFPYCLRWSWPAYLPFSICGTAGFQSVSFSVRR